jgi:hypothetical protein
MLTNEQKAKRLEDLAKPFQQRAKNFRVYAEAREKARHHDRAKSDHDIADLAESDAALLRESAALWRGDTAQENARLEAAMKEIAVFAQGLRERTDVPTFVVIGHMIEGYLNKHAAKAAAVAWVDSQEGE